MKKSRFTEEQIIGILKQHEAGMKTADLCREHGISPATFYGWKSKYGGMDVSEAQRLRQMEDENRRLKQLVADLSLDREVLKGVIPKKRLELAGLREDVAFAQGEYAMSERTACKLLGVERSSYRYEPRPDRNAELREELLKLARQKPRYGYRRLQVLLERRGHEVNVKRVYRLYVEEGLSVRRRKRKRLVRDRAREPRLLRANQEWAMDFIVDGLATGRMVRILSVVDAYTRECLALEADTSLGSGRVTRVLDRLIEERGRPDNVRSDNGPEFTSRRIVGWAEERKVELVHIQPGRPMQNGHVESFHGRLRDECLNTSWFRTLGDVRQKLADWRQEYNTERPHSSLDYRTPDEFKRACDQSRAMALLSSQNINHQPTETPVMNG
ncbi:MAG TPA: IS3 family transposase [Acidobacteriaceae bacterium]|nr:IS3 family transposase [Acidobacteriaceae bacterium]